MFEELMMKSVYLAMALQFDTRTPKMIQHALAKMFDLLK